MSVQNFQTLLNQNIGNSTAIALILADKDFLNSREDEKVDALISPDGFGESFLEKVIQTSVLEVKAVFDSTSFNETESLLKIFKYRNDNNKTPLDLACEASPDAITAILNSKAFSILNVTQQTDVIRDRYNNEQSKNTLLQNSITHTDTVCLEALVNNGILNNWPQENIFEILDDKDAQDKNIIHKTIRKSAYHFKVILNSKLVQKLETEQVFKLFYNCDSNDNYLLKNVIMMAQKHPDENSLEAFFKGNPFNVLSELQQQKILFMGEPDSSKSLWRNVADNELSIKQFVDHAPLSLQKYFIEFIKEYYWEYCCKGYLKSVPVREIVSFDDVIKIANASEQYKNIVDSEDFSFLYYLSTYGLKISTIKSLLNNGFKLITKQGFEVLIEDSHLIFSSKEAVGNVLSITGEYSKNDILSGLDKALHQKGYNILAVNANYDLNLKNSDIYPIIGNYGAAKNISFVILNAHGNPTDLKDSDVSLWIYERSNKISSKILFKELVKLIGSDKALEVLVTSCNGQLATKVLKGILPNGSKMVTFGEKTAIDKEGHHTQVHDMQQIARTITLASDDDIDIRPITLERMLIDYLMHLSNTSAIKGIPTYTKGKNAKLVIDIKSKDKCVLNLEVKQKEALASQLCDSKDTKCKDLFNLTLEHWSNDPSLGKKSSLSDMQKNMVNDELGALQAINFAYSVYCQDTGKSMPNKDFCCNNLPESSPNSDSHSPFANLVEYFSSLWYNNASSQGDEL